MSGAQYFIISRRAESDDVYVSSPKTLEDARREARYDTGTDGKSTTIVRFVERVEAKAITTSYVVEKI